MTSLRRARWLATSLVAMRSASASMTSASPITTSSIASLTSSSKRDMWTPFCSGLRSQKQASSAWKSRSSPLWRMRIAFAERVTPARERLMAAAGLDSCRSSGRERRVVLIGTRFVG